VEEVGNKFSMLSLSEAIRRGQLSAFIEQEQARGIGPAESLGLDALVAEAAKAPQSADQALRSPSGDGSTGK
jgi:hypothetical protein